MIVPQWIYPDPGDAEAWRAADEKLRRELEARHAQP